MKMRNARRQWMIKAIGLIFFLLGAYYSVSLFLPLQFNPNPQVWFTASYYSQFIPFYTALTLAICGFCVFFKLSQANFYLAIFGHTASEEIAFSWLGLSTTQLPTAAIYLFFPLSLLALYLAYFNVLGLKRLSLSEAIFGFVTSTAFIVLPRL